MSWIEIILIGAGLSLDVFAYALCRGAVVGEIDKKSLVILGGGFTLWNLISLTAGNFVAKIPVVSKNAEYAANDWKYISVAIFLGLGIYLIIKAARGKEIEERKAERLESRQFAMWMAITSLDVFIAGIGFGFLDTVFFKTFIVILLITPVSVIAGLYAGWWAGCQARKKIVAGNWKMNMTPSQAVKLVEELKPLVVSDDVEVVYCVPAIDIVPVAEAIKGSNVKLGAENFYIEDKGAFTGEISAPMLKDAGVEYIIIGHSERRDIFGENDILINQKVKKAFAAGLKPILCCGESLALRKAGTYKEWIARQIKWDLTDVTADQVKELVIAYEPIWAIGTGETATADQAQEVCKMIREVIAEMYDTDTAEAVRIQYGGSMNAGNAAELLSKDDIDGGLIGGAALKPDFGKIVNA